MMSNPFDKYRYQRQEGEVSLPTLTKRKIAGECPPQTTHQQPIKKVIHIPEKVVERKRRKKNARQDLSKAHKREAFFLFFPEARNATGASKGYKCIICKENLMYLDVTNSWNASHIRPIKHCPVRDPKYVLPTCTSCNGRMGLREADQMNAFDMMAHYNYKERIYPIAKVLHHRYAEEGASVLSFIHDTYGKATRNQEGALDPRLVITSKEVYEEVARREAEELRDRGQEEVDEKTSQIHDIHEEIKQLLLQVERVRTQERGAMLRMFQSVLDYDEEKKQIFNRCGAFF